MCGWCSSPAGRSRSWRAISAFPRRRCVSGCDSAEVDAGKREGLSTNEREELKRLRSEVFELRRANSILKEASVDFARELDPNRPS